MNTHILKNPLEVIRAVQADDGAGVQLQVVSFEVGAKFEVVSWGDTMCVLRHGNDYYMTPTAGFNDYFSVIDGASLNRNADWFTGEN